MAVMGDLMAILEDRLDHLRALLDDHAGNEEGRTQIIAAQQMRARARRRPSSHRRPATSGSAAWHNWDRGRSTSSRRRDRRSGKAGSRGSVKGMFTPHTRRRAPSRRSTSTSRTIVATISRVEMAAIEGSTPRSIARKDRHRQRRLPRRQQEQCHRRLVERGDEGEDETGEQRHPHARQDDERESCEPVGAEHARGLLQRRIEAGQPRQRRAHDIGRDDDDMGERKNDEIAAQAEEAHILQQRDADHDGGKNQRRKQEAGNRAAERQPIVMQRITGRNRQQQGDKRRRDREFEAERDGARDRWDR